MKKLVFIVIVISFVLSGNVYGYEYLGLDPDEDRDSIFDELTFSEVMEYYDESELIDYLYSYYSTEEIAEMFDIPASFFEVYDMDSEELAQELDYNGYLEYSDMYFHLLREGDIPDMADILAGISVLYPEKMEFFFSLADDFGCDPSMILGTYCQDVRSRVIHYTDNVRKEHIPYEDMGFPILDYSIADIKYRINDENNWEFHGFTFCPSCFMNSD